MTIRKRQISPSRTGPPGRVRPGSTRRTIPSFHYSIIPVFRCSTIPFFHHSIIPIFHYSIVPVFDSSILPPFHARRARQTNPIYHRGSPPSGATVPNKANSPGRDGFGTSLLTRSGTGERPSCETKPICRRGPHEPWAAAPSKANSPTGLPANRWRCAKQSQSPDAELNASAFQ